MVPQLPLLHLALMAACTECRPAYFRLRQSAILMAGCLSAGINVYLSVIRVCVIDAIWCQCRFLFRPTISAILRYQKPIHLCVVNTHHLILSWLQMRSLLARLM